MTDLPFVVQPLAFPDLDVFTTKLTATQQAQVLARALDLGFQRQVAKEPMLNPDERVKAYFSKENREYLQGPSRPPNALKISVNGITTYQINNRVSSAYDNYMQIILQNGGVGKEKAKYIAQLVRSSFAIASRASEAQLEREKIGTGKNPGLLKFGFPTRTQDPQSGLMAGVLGKFIEPTLLRESLLEYRAGFPSTLKGTEMGQMLMDELSPGNNMAQEMVQVMSRTEGDALQRRQMASRLRFQKLMPHFSQLGSTTQNIVRKVKHQHTTLNGFKPRPSGRFLFED